MNSARFAASKQDTTSRRTRKRGCHMGKIFDPSAEKLRYLLASIHNREMALPDFQRDFVWDPSATEELIESICQSFPAGSLLRIRNHNGFFFVPREFAGAPLLDGHAPSYLTLDGQQRLTSLYQAFYGAGSHQYFMDLNGLISGKDLEDCVFFMRNRDGESEYGTIASQAKALVFPLRRLFGDNNGFEEWLDEILEIRPEPDEEKKELKKALRSARETWLKPVDDYEFPMVTLVEGTGAEAVCTIFETLNRTGVKLSVFDLLAARFWPEELRLRDLWKTAQAASPILADFKVDPYYVLQSIALVTAEAPSCKRSDVLKMDVARVRTSWDRVVGGFVSALNMLRDDCGVILPEWLPYSSILIPLSSLMAHVETLTGPQAGAARNKVKRWFWCSVFGQAYDNAANSQAAKDFTDVKRWIADGQPPEVVTSFAFDVESLRNTTPRQRAIYKGVIALVLRNGALDFHNATQITSGMMTKERIEDHHVFPRDYIGSSMPEVTDTLRDCVLNRTLIDKSTNASIRNRPPALYLGEVRASLGDQNFNRLLSTHLLPAGEGSPLLRNDFERFLEIRQQLISEKIQQVTS